MCKAKNADGTGGKRCLIHHPATQAIVRMVSFRTGADEQTIRESMRELNKEGRNLPDVSGAEAQAEVDKLAFDASTESILDGPENEHERKMQLKQLARARDEVKNGAKGAHVYVWKNLFKRVITKMKAARKIAYVGAFLLPLALASCSAGMQPNTHSTAPSTSISQSATPTQSASASTGDVVVSKSTITDELGSYKPTTLDPNSTATKFQKDLIDPTEQKTSGFSDAQVAAGQKWVVGFVADQGMDSIAIDRGSKGWSEWESKYASKYLVAKYKDQILSYKDSSTDRPLLILNDPNNSYAQLARDGGSRVKTEKITVQQMRAGKDATGQQYLQVNGNAVATYRATDAGILTSIKKLNPGATDAKLKAEYPELFNGKNGDVDVQYTFNFSYTVLPSGSSWKIAGINNTLSVKDIGLKNG